MSQPQPSDLDPLLVRDYLRDNPQFFEHFPELLNSLRINHHQRGAISLVERQQQLLRQRVQEQEQEITSLLAIATRNDDIHNFFSKLLFELLAIKDIDKMTTRLCRQLQTKFRFTSVKLYQRGDDQQFSKTELEAIIKHRLDGRGYYLGRLPAQEARLLVGIETGSVALIGLGGSDNWLGVLAIASHEPSHFSPEMGTMLIDNLQQLLSHRLQHG
ncbi:DUF484 family protein [Ferrimonas lipolytica]|uniref:DUF484 family protein n=1 Tax=Ferrimonas lipolytica TaxID=2724191 RepID=A0A6H1UHK6_9GAMM|nr:DUF484 family protein [Ferrimonas lipolytica]QIZ78109.1 DUF484 family protein [Ferrimonas lipolytica]